MTQQWFVYGQVYELEAGWSIRENQSKKVTTFNVFFVCFFPPTFHPVVAKLDTQKITTNPQIKNKFLLWSQLFLNLSISK